MAKLKTSVQAFTVSNKNGLPELIKDIDRYKKGDLRGFGLFMINIQSKNIKSVSDIEELIKNLEEIKVGFRRFK